MKLSLLNRDCLKGFFLFQLQLTLTVLFEFNAEEIKFDFCCVVFLLCHEMMCHVFSPSKMDMHYSIWGESFQNSRKKTCRRFNNANLFFFFCSLFVLLLTVHTRCTANWNESYLSSYGTFSKKQIQLKKLKPSLLKNNPHSLRAPVRSFTDETCFQIVMILLVLLFFSIYLFNF